MPNEQFSAIKWQEHHNTNLFSPTYIPPTSGAPPKKCRLKQLLNTVASVYMCSINLQIAYNNTTVCKLLGSNCLLNNQLYTYLSGQTDPRI